MGSSSSRHDKILDDIIRVTLLTSTSSLKPDDAKKIIDRIASEKRVNIKSTQPARTSHVMLIGRLLENLGLARVIVAGGENGRTTEIEAVEPRTVRYREIERYNELRREKQYCDTERLALAGESEVLEAYYRGEEHSYEYCGPPRLTPDWTLQRR